MFPQERPALFRVAGVAGLIHGRLHQHSGGVRSMRAVTLAAGHLAETHRMYRRLVEVRALLPVAGVANIGLGDRGEHGIALSVNLVASAAREAIAFVRAGNPAGARIAPMALQTELVALRGRQEGCRPEIIYRVLVAATCNVLGARPVAGLALQSASSKRSARIGAHGMLGLEDGKDRIGPSLRMAHQAGVSSFVGVFGA